MKRILVQLLAFVILMGLLPNQTNVSGASNVITNDQIEAAIAWGENFLSPTDSSAFYGLCAAFVFHAYNEGAGIANSSYSTATAMGNALITNTDSNPPRGALVFWYIPDVPAGHVALSLGNGKIIHSWGNKPKCVVSGTVANVTNYYGASNYRGWGAPIPGYKLATDTSGTPATAPSYTGVSHGSITSSNAVISATCQNPSKYTLKTGGFYLSTVPGAAANGTKYTDTIPTSYQTATSIPCSYNLQNEYSIPLSSGTKYYYVLYVTDSAGNFYYSQEYSFSTTSIPVTSVTLNPTSKSLNIGSTVQISASVSPSNASNKNITWSSSNTAVATVSSSGLVTAKGVGTATIYATATDGSGKSGSATITVSCNHSFGYTTLPAVAPSCTQTGLTEGKRCNACGTITVVQTTVPSTGHDHTATVTPPTCSAGGYTTYTCHCGDSYIGDETSALGHTEQTLPGKAATCTETGMTDGKRCSTCGETLVEQEEIPVLDHDHVNGKCACGDELRSRFVDVLAGSYYFNPVEWAVENGITNGIDESHFAPLDSCTRGQIVTFLWRACGSTEPMMVVNPFSDVSSGDYFYKAVLWAVENGITSGIGDGMFAPYAGCTRAQVATFLWRSQGQPVSGGENTFTDLVPGAYYYDAVLWAVENGITNGIGDGTFAPNDTCTRGQIVTFLYRAMAK